MHLKLKIFCLTAILASSVLYNVAHAQKQPEINYYVAAYIWPSCHDDPLAREKLWKEGIGEWEEGSYLLPDMLNGFGYLEAVKEVFVDGKYDRY